MKIAIYGICLNEAKFVDRFMDACAGADYVVIADTGSTDGTQDMFRARGAQVHQIKVQPWRFDHARNAALALVPEDADVCFALDIDEVLSGGWREKLEAAWVEGTTRGQYLLVYSHQADGSPGVQFLNARIHSRNGYFWRHICHEALYPDGVEDKFVVVEGLQVDHYPDLEKSRGAYLGMLERAVKAEPHEPRMAHYLAREYFYNRRYEEAIAEFQRYLDMNGHFTSERVASMIFIGKCLDGLGRDPLPWYHKAVAELPTVREPWIALAEAYYKLEDWPNCYAAAVKGLSLSPPPDRHVRDPRCYGATPDDLAALGAWNIGLHEVATRHARAALAYAPEDERLRNNLKFMEDFLEDRKEPQFEPH
ncbi:hypothetical protein SZ64_10000 [Erythrobacter sp. SG61-1L]|uniref:glycosyltransferase family 2 protein n=1 Tax=Erythrobacter sp. SG61-1L TaxID=1603897 RepID=UPI0006C8E717|nr:glycosyltransferase family 2 protein [Erythrobacter sp. SG61-1L]KPL68422.1 hypothetical protein SZ64_10000 [Erythrobacter sp. SG61-1L]